MNPSVRAFLRKIKKILLRLPGAQILNKIRHDRIRYIELSNLINENEIVVLHPFSKMKNGEPVTREIVHEVVKDFLDVYGTVKLGKKTATSIKAPTYTTLLYAPLALLSIPATHDEYFDLIGYAGRRKIRKAMQQNYEFKEFDWNDHLDEIYKINTSKEVRQAQPMLGWYRYPVQPRYHTSVELQYRKYYGAFKDGNLCAYLHLILCGDFGFFKHFLGHAEHLQTGIMYGLISWIVGEFVKNHEIQWLKYGELSKESSTMHQFRKTAGFKGYATLLDLEGDQELIEYSKHKVRLLRSV